MKLDKIVLLSVVLCAIVIFGEVAAYSSGFQKYDADVRWDDNIATYTVSSSGADTYDIMAVDNGAFRSPVVVYIYSDDAYEMFLGDAQRSSGVAGMDIDWAIDQVTKSLKVRGVTDIQVLDAEGLFNAMSGDRSNSSAKALIVMSYALPEQIYSGSEGDLLFKWISEGGSLYWACSFIGMFYTTSDGLEQVDDYQELFFGSDCINTGDTNYAYSEVYADGLTDALSLKWNRVRYAADVSSLEGSLSLGYSEGGFSSVSMVPFGEGMICVIGGTYDRNLCDDLSQIVSSGVSCYSHVIKIINGNITRTTVSGTISVPEGSGEIRTYICIGGDYTVFGRAFDHQ